MDKDLLDAIGTAISKALASSESRIRRLENQLAATTEELAAVKATNSVLSTKLDIHETTLVDLNEKAAAATASIDGVVERTTSLEGGLIVVSHTMLPEVRDKAAAALAESALALDTRMDELAGHVSTIVEDLTLAEGSIADCLKSVEQVKEENADQFAGLGCAIAAIDKRLAAETKSYPVYETDEVVRAGDIRRFGFGGLFEATKDTAKGVLDAPGDWRMLSDGLYLADSTEGLCMKSYTGAEYLLRHGAEGKEGQRGKQGLPGLRGNDGAGIVDFIPTPKGFVVETSTGKMIPCDLSEVMEQSRDGLAEHVVVEIAPVIKTLMAEYSNAQLQ
jgi:hypothetical protein